MNDAGLDLKRLIIFQRWSWRALMLLFAASCAFYSLGVAASEWVGVAGVLALFAATVIRLGIIAARLRSAGLYRLWLLCLAIFAVLLAIVLVKVVAW